MACSRYHLSLLDWTVAQCTNFLLSNLYTSRHISADSPLADDIGCKKKEVISLRIFKKREYLIRSFYDFLEAILTYITYFDTVILTFISYYLYYS